MLLLIPLSVYILPLSAVNHSSSFSNESVLLPSGDRHLTLQSLQILLMQRHQRLGGLHPASASNPHLCCVPVCHQGTSQQYTLRARALPVPHTFSHGSQDQSASK